MAEKINALLCVSSAVYRRYVDHWQDKFIKITHLPVEQFEWMNESPAIDDTLNNLEHYENLVFNELDSTRQFLAIVENAEKLEILENKVCFVANKDIASELEQKGLPAIEPLKADKAIDVVETMLRFRRTGPALLPTRKNRVNDIAGFLEELTIEVNELPVYKKVPLEDDTIDSYRNKIPKLKLDCVFFHSREAVNSIPAVFSNINFREMKNIAGNKVVAQKLIAADIPVSATLKDDLSALDGIIREVSHTD